MQDLKFKYQQISVEIEGQIEIWKIARLGFMLSVIQKKIPEVNFNSLLLMMFLSHFKYSDLNFIVFNNVTGDHKPHFVRIMLNRLAKIHLVEKVSFATDNELALLYPQNVYLLTPKAIKMMKKLHSYLDGTNNFLDYNI